MSLPIEFDSDARSEFLASIDWYESKREGLGLEFLDEIRTVLRLIRFRSSIDRSQAGFWCSRSFTVREIQKRGNTGSEPRIRAEGMTMRALELSRRSRVMGANYFGALDLAAQVAARFRVPEGGGPATDPSWSEQRLVRLSPKTLQHLEKLAEKSHASPMQVAALLLEGAVQAIVNQE
jgi:hypothetical protein